MWESIPYCLYISSRLVPSPYPLWGVVCLWMPRCPPRLQMAHISALPTLYIRLCKHVCVRSYTYACTYVCTCIYVCMYDCMTVYVCIYVYVRVCMYVSICKLYIEICYFQLSVVDLHTTHLSFLPICPSLPASIHISSYPSPNLSGHQSLDTPPPHLYH